jgi:hypothetical protein
MLLLAILACNRSEDLPPEINEEIDQVETALALTQGQEATDVFIEQTAAAQAATDEALLATPTPTHTPPPSATPTDTALPTSTPTLDPTEAALAECVAAVQELVDCINGAVLPIFFPDGAPDHRIVNNSDPTTLYRSEDILAMLNAPGASMVHNNYTRPVNCPFTTACVLHVLLIAFDSEEESLAFFERVTQIPDENETELPAPNADDWDDSKCAETTRPSSAENAPPFAVIFCSVAEGKLHWGFNLSAYEGLPPEFVEQDLEVIMAQVHDYLSVWE